MTIEANDALQNAESVSDIEAAERRLKQIIDKESHKLFTVQVQGGIDSLATAFDLFEKHRITTVQLGERVRSFCDQIDDILNV